MRMPSLALIAAAIVVALPIGADACTWKIALTPQAGPNNVLQGVSGSSTSDVWAVGKYYTQSGGPFTLTEHWNGSSWSIVPSPNPASGGNQLYGVADLSPTDAWAVGQDSTSGVMASLILHWNGSGWSQVKAPVVSGHVTNLQAITAVSANDIWADGLAVPFSGGVLEPLIEHWNGKRWKVVSSPNLGTWGSTIYTISAAGRNDIWATGGTALNSGFTDFATLAMHWTGKQWAIVPTPNQGTIDSLLNAVVNVAPGDAWAVGDSYNGSLSIFNTLTEHWDGTQWSLVKSPTVGSFGNALIGVGAVSSDAVFAVGKEFTSAGSVTLSLKWNGKHWAHLRSPNLPGGNPDFLSAAAGIPGTTTLWGVGLNTFPSGNADQAFAAVDACALTDPGDDTLPAPSRAMPLGAGRTREMLPRVGGLRP